MKINAVYVARIACVTLVASCGYLADALAEDYVFPKGTRIVATRSLDNLRPAIGETIKVTFSLSNQEPDPVRGLYYADHIPKEFEVFTDSVLINGESVNDYVYEVGQSDSVYPGAVAHRWILEAPGSSSSGTHPIHANLGTVKIVYSLVWVATGVFTFHTYNWIGVLSGQREDQAFGYGDSIIVTEVPVRLSSFSAKVNRNSVELNWSTATEDNNYGFEVQRSIDGVDFEVVAFVRGAGTTTIPHHYSFVDRIVSTGTFYYRLKQIDGNGSIEYSEILSVELLPPRNFVLEQNYPNPFNDQTEIQYSLPFETHVELVIFDVAGRHVTTLVRRNETAGRKTVTWDGRNESGSVVTSGTYFYGLRAPRFSEFNKLLFLK